MKIDMPRYFDLTSATKFCCELDALGEDDKYVYDYASASSFRPIGMLLISAKIRQFMNKRKNAKHLDVNFENHTYAAHMGYFKSVYQDYGKAPGEASGNMNYIPITRIDISDIRRESTDEVRHVGEIIEMKARHLASVLARGSIGIEKYLTFAIREMFRNIEEHSEARSIWFAGQYWPSRDSVQIAILDEGVGIYQTLSNNPHYEINNDQDALTFALQPGITRAFGKSSSFNDNTIWSNSGYGLFMTSSLCRYGGAFAICSGKAVLNLSKSIKIRYGCSFNGTAVLMQLRVTDLLKVKNIMPTLTKRGQHIAKENSRYSIITASKASKLLQVVFEDQKI